MIKQIPEGKVPRAPAGALTVDPVVGVPGPLALETGSSGTPFPAAPRFLPRDV